MSQTKITPVVKWRIATRGGGLIFTMDGEYIGTCKYEDQADRFVERHNAVVKQAAAVPKMIEALEKIITGVNWSNQDEKMGRLEITETATAALRSAGIEVE